MDDKTIHDHIEGLVAQERALWEKRGDGTGLDAVEHERLERLRIELDRYWDLLRQRRALEEFGMDADVATLRSVETVEGYDA